MASSSSPYRMQSHHLDSTKWIDFQYRPDDIIISTAYKSGTTWMQTIVLKLTHQGRPIPTNPSTICHWLDLRVPPAEVQHRALEDIKERRQIKTHLRFDAIKYDPNAKYIYIGRDGRDCYMSLINHYRQGNDLWYGVINGPPAFVGDPLPVFDEAVHSESKLFDRWISEGWPSLPGETDGYPFWSLFDHVRTWWEVRHLPNILFVHYNDLLSDLAGGVREIARFLDIAIDEENFPAMIESLTFEGMKATCCIPEQTLVPMGGAIFKNGGNSFINKGTNGRWRGVLTPAQLAKYDEVVKRKLTPECAAWLEHGKAAL